MPAFGLFTGGKNITPTYHDHVYLALPDRVVKTDNTARQRINQHRRRASVQASMKDHES